MTLFDIGFDRIQFSHVPILFVQVVRYCNSTLHTEFDIVLLKVTRCDVSIFHQRISLVPNRNWLVAWRWSVPVRCAKWQAAETQIRQRGAYLACGWSRIKESGCCDDKKNRLSDSENAYSLWNKIEMLGVCMVCVCFLIFLTVFNLCMSKGNAQKLVGPPETWAK